MKIRDFRHTIDRAKAARIVARLCMSRTPQLRIGSLRDGHSYIHVTYGLIPQIGKTSVARDAAQAEVGEHRRPF